MVDDKARALLTSVPVKQEVAERTAILTAILISTNSLEGVKFEAEDVKANIRDTGTCYTSIFCDILPTDMDSLPTVRCIVKCTSAAKEK